MRQAQAQRGARDRNTRPQDDVRHVGDGLVIGRFLVFASLTGFLVSTQVKNRIVRRGTQDQGHQQIRRERGDLDDSLLHEERDDASGHRQRGEHPEQRDQCDRDRPIGNQQQDDDQDDRHDRQLDQARIRGVQRIGRQWCRSGDIGRAGRPVSVPSPRCRGSRRSTRSPSTIPGRRLGGSSTWSPRRRRSGAPTW